MDKVSVIIATYNRFNYVLNTIKSVKEQTYKNIEIIVVNDCSTQKEYYEYNWCDNNVIILHLEKNTKQMFGFACAGYVRNKGIEIASGNYIAFCDDDDIWFSSKIELQLNAMKETGCRMSSTDGLMGHGMYDSKKKYEIFNDRPSHHQTVKNIYKRVGSNLFDNGFPKIWTFNFLKVHNCMVCSSVIMEKSLLDSINNMKCVKNGEEDYDCWLRALKITNSVYLNDICFYYDLKHGDGQQY